MIWRDESARHCRNVCFTLADRGSGLIESMVGNVSSLLPALLCIVHVSIVRHLPWSKCVSKVAKNIMHFFIPLMPNGYTPDTQVVLLTRLSFFLCKTWNALLFVGLVKATSLVLVFGFLPQNFARWLGPMSECYTRDTWVFYWQKLSFSLYITWKAKKF